MVHGQSRSVATFTVPVPPVAVNVEDELLTVIPHRVALGALATLVVLEVQAAARGNAENTIASRKIPRCMRYDPRRLMHAARQRTGHRELNIFRSNITV